MRAIRTLQRGHGGGGIGATVPCNVVVQDVEIQKNTHTQNFSATTEDATTRAGVLKKSVEQNFLALFFPYVYVCVCMETCISVLMRTTPLIPLNAEGAPGKCKRCAVRVRGNCWFKRNDGEIINLSCTLWVAGIEGDKMRLCTVFYEAIEMHTRAL